MCSGLVEQNERLKLRVIFFLYNELWKEKWDSNMARRKILL